MYHYINIYIYIYMYMYNVMMCDVLLSDEVCFVGGNYKRL